MVKKLITEVRDDGVDFPEWSDGARWDCLTHHDIERFRKRMLLEQITHVEVSNADDTQTLPTGTFSAMEWLQEQQDYLDAITKPRASQKE